MRLVDGGFGGPILGRFFGFPRRRLASGVSAGGPFLVWFWGFGAQDSGGEITGAADAADTRLLRCYGVLGLDFFECSTNVRLLDGGSGGEGWPILGRFFSAVPHGDWRQVVQDRAQWRNF